MPVFANNIEWYFKIRININSLNLKKKKKIKLKLHYFHAMLKMNTVQCNCRIFHVEKNNFEGEMSHVEIY